MNHTVLFVATSTTGGTEFTTSNGQAKPSKVAATRVTTLARSASKLVKERGAGLEPKTLFSPSLRDYDILIHLNQKASRSILRVHPTDSTDGADERQHSRFKISMNGRRRTRCPWSGTRPRSHISQLGAAYSGSILFFYGAAEDSVVGGHLEPPDGETLFQGQPSLSHTNL